MSDDVCAKMRKVTLSNNLMTQLQNNFPSRLHTVQCFRALLPAACCPPNALSSAMTYGLLVFSSGQEVRVECDFGSKSDQQL